jgi:hypothetical protein
MAFFAPYMLWGMLAGGIPIALHFFYRSRYRTVPWAAMKFLLTSIEQTSRRLRFQELILLVLRVALLVILALALARPKSMAERGSAQGDAVDAVFVIDTSYSMGARDGVAPLKDPQGDPYLTALKNLASNGVVTRLHRAKAAALSVLDRLPPHSTVQVIASSNRAVALGPQAPAHLDQARQIIEELPVTHQATDYLPGVKEAGATLERGHSPNKELYLFSDMQKLGWEAQAGPLAEQLNHISKKATIHLVRCANRTPNNVAVIGIAPPEGIPHTGERADFAVLVRNSSPAPVRNLKVTLEIDGRAEEKDSQPLDVLAPGETKTVTLSGKLHRSGLLTVSAMVASDDLEADNRFDQVLHVRDQVRILVIDGAPNERDARESASFYLMHTLVPLDESYRGEYHIQPTMITPRQAVARLLADKDLCVLVNVSLQPDDTGRMETLGPEFTEALAGFVRNGKGLVVFGGDHVNADAYNQVLYQQNGLLPLKLRHPVTVPMEKAFKLDRQSADGSPFLWRFREDKYYEAINEMPIWGALDVEEPAPEDKSANPGEGARVLIRYSTGRPALVSRRVGAGEVMLVTMSADLSWTVWPLWKGMYPPLVRQVLIHLLQEQAQSYNRMAGEPLTWHASEAEMSKTFAVIRPDGKRVRLGIPEVLQGRPLVTSPETPSAGIYRLVHDEEEVEKRPIVSISQSDAPIEAAPAGVPFAVVPDLRESEDLSSWSDGQIDERLVFKPVHLLAGDDPGVFSGSDRLNREWTIWLLAALLGVTLAETIWAWFCGRSW